MKSDFYRFISKNYYEFSTVESALIIPQLQRWNGVIWLSHKRIFLFDFVGESFLYPFWNDEFFIQLFIFEGKSEANVLNENLLRSASKFLEWFSESIIGIYLQWLSNQLFFRWCSSEAGHSNMKPWNPLRMCWSCTAK